MELKMYFVEYEVVYHDQESTLHTVKALATSAKEAKTKVYQKWLLPAHADGWLNRNPFIRDYRIKTAKVAQKKQIDSQFYKEIPDTISGSISTPIIY